MTPAAWLMAAWTMTAKGFAAMIGIHYYGRLWGNRFVMTQRVRNTVRPGDAAVRRPVCPGDRAVAGCADRERDRRLSLQAARNLLNRTGADG